MKTGIGECLSYLSALVGRLLDGVSSRARRVAARAAAGVILLSTGAWGFEERSTRFAVQAETRATIARLEADKEALRGEIVFLQKLVKANEQAARDLTELVEEQTRDAIRESEEAAESERALRRIEASYRALEDRVRALRRTLGEKDAEIERVSGENRQLAKRIVALEDETEQLAKIVLDAVPDHHQADVDNLTRLFELRSKLSSDRRAKRFAGLCSRAMAMLMAIGHRDAVRRRAGLRSPLKNTVRLQAAVAQHCGGDQ